MRKRTSVTYEDAEKVRKLVMKRFKSWLDAGIPEPTIMENWDGRGNYAIVWGDGPYEWSYYGSLMSMGYAEREPEFGFTLPIVKVPASLSHVFTEPYNTAVLMLYLEG